MNTDLCTEAKTTVTRIDQRVTAHCILSERYNRLATISDYLLISTTILLTVSAFAPSFFIRLFNIQTQHYETAVSIFSLLVLIYTIISWKADWRGKGYEHDYAKKTLSRLKIHGRELLASSNPESNVNTFLSECNATQANIIPIPEYKFIKLKALHKRKVALSKFIDDNPGLSPFMIYIKFSARNFLLLFNK